MKTALVDFDTDPKDDGFVKDFNVCYIKAIDMNYVSVLAFLVQQGAAADKVRVKF